MSKTKIYSRFNRPVSPGFACAGESLTQQQFRDETDINKIVERAVRTGNAELFTSTERAEFYDSSNFVDYQTSLGIIADVKDDFDSLPARTRRQFDDNPDNYVAFMINPRNAQKAIEMGLLPTSVVNQPPAGSKTDAPAGAPSESPPKGDKTPADGD